MLQYALYVILGGTFDFSEVGFASSLKTFCKFKNCFDKLVLFHNTIVRHTKYKKMVVCPFAGEIPTKVFDSFSLSFISLVISPFLKNNDKDGKMPLQLV